MPIYLGRHVIRERCSEGIGGGQVKDGEPNKPKHRKWTPEITGMIDRDKYDKTVMGPYEHGPLHQVYREDGQTKFDGPPDTSRRFCGMML